MYGVVAEDSSDAQTLRVLVQRACNLRVSIKTKGFGGCGELLSKGARQLRAFADLGCTRFLVCYDADKADPGERKREAERRIVVPSGIDATSCVCLIPVQEIEAWILADISHAGELVIPSWKPPNVTNCESINDPKEYLKRLSRGSNKKPLYSPAIHNEVIANHLSLSRIVKECPSFRPFWRFVVASREVGAPPEGRPASAGQNLWAYIRSNTGSEYRGQVGTSHEWGQLVRYLESLPEQPPELIRLHEYGWCDLGILEAEIASLLKKSAPKGISREILQMLQATAADRGDARYLGIDDGTR